jgi:hypothetical protein
MKTEHLNITSAIALCNELLADAIVLKHQPTVDRIREILRLLTVVSSSRVDQSSLNFAGGMYYQSGDDTPFCGSCYEDKNKQIHLVAISPSFAMHGQWKCPICHTIT